MKKVLRSISFVLIMSLLCSVMPYNVFATNTSTNSQKVQIEKSLKANKKKVQADIEYSKKLQQSDNQNGISKMPIAIVGVYAIPGVGQVAVAITGTIIIGGITIAVGSWLYSKIKAWFASSDTEVKDQAKDKDQLVGKPGETKVKGYRETKIGSNGKATRQRHNTVHTNPTEHTNPHDHTITWDKKGNPQFSKPINYPNGSVPPLNIF